MLLAGAGHAESLCLLDRAVEAVPAIQECHAELMASLGEEHITTLAVASLLGMALVQCGEREEGQSLLVSTHAAQLERLGEGHIDVVRTARRVAEWCSPVDGCEMTE